MAPAAQSPSTAWARPGEGDGTRHAVARRWPGASPLERGVRKAES